MITESNGKMKIGIYCYLIEDILKILQKCSLSGPLPHKTSHFDWLSWQPKH